MRSRILLLLITAVFLIISLSATPVSASYDFEGLPLHVSAQGEVQGKVLVSGTYGLATPPTDFTYSLPSKPVWARVYTGVWGGTERYTGWEELTVNNGIPVRKNLFGIDDRDKDTYVTGYGVYWIAHDCTDEIHGGKNTISLTTSRGLPESKIDGRVYGLLVVAIVEDKDAPLTRYWVAEGNENLHGEGWAGANPTKHDSCEISFEKANPAKKSTGNLSVLLLATTKGQPDYISFNGEDLGDIAADTTAYPAGARDIGNEQCYDATGGAGIDTRYVDFETFDVTNLLNNKNTVIFERGRDLDGDGTITTTGIKPEGEDYIHPCCAILTVTQPGAKPGPDYSVDTPRVKNAYAGEEATIQATVRNYGTQPEGTVKVHFLIDEIIKQTVALEPAASGVSEVSANLTMNKGSHTVTTQVETDGKLNHEASTTIMVGTIPDISVSIGAPAGANATQKSPSLLITAIAGLCIAGLLIKRPPHRKLAAVLITGIIITASCPLLTPIAGAESYENYDIPVTITNSGGSDAPPFDLTIYLDGEKTAVKLLKDGVKAGETIEITIPLYTMPGKHSLKVIADEKGAIRDANKENNVAEETYDFP